jgi:hypothetical protein
MVRFLLRQQINNGGIMQGKTLVAFLIIIIAIGAGLYFFQKDRQSKELLAHKIHQLQQITKTAEKSSSAGLLVMASAINKFHQTRGVYPERLVYLYPEFIPDKGFISKLDWKYEPGQDTYRLQKTVDKGKDIASIGPNLRLKTVKPGMPLPAQMVAAAGKAATPMPPVKQPSGKLPGESKTDKIVKKAQPAGILPRDQVQESAQTAPEKKESNLKLEAPIQIITKELDRDEKFLLSFNNNSLYIWKTDDGAIGFSNIQYPDKREILIYQNQTWMEYTGKHLAP